MHLPFLPRTEKCGEAVCTIPILPFWPNKLEINLIDCLVNCLALLIDIIYYMKVSTWKNHKLDWELSSPWSHHTLEMLTVG